MVFSFLDRDQKIAAVGYSRWLVPPAALAIHLPIEQEYRKLCKIVFRTSLIVAIFFCASTARPALALDSVSIDEPLAGKPPVGDFDPPNTRQIKIIDDAPTIPDYRSVPKGPEGEKSLKKIAYVELWKSVCHNDAEIQFILSKRPYWDGRSQAFVDGWIANTEQHVEERDYRKALDDFESAAENSTGKKLTLTPNDRISILQIIQRQKEALDDALKHFLSPDPKKSEVGRASLVKMAGQAAFERFERATSALPSTDAK